MLLQLDSAVVQHGGSFEEISYEGGVLYVTNWNDDYTNAGFIRNAIEDVLYIDV